MTLGQDLDARLAEIDARLAALEGQSAPTLREASAAGRVVLSGPRFESTGALTPEALYRAFGRDVEHGTHGVHTTFVPASAGMIQSTRGGGRSIVDDRLQVWLDFKPSNHVVCEFETMFSPNGGDRWGDQAKFGVGIEAHHSGKQWPGGGFLASPDWSARWVWNNYERWPNTDALRYGLYLYGPRADHRELRGQVWATDVPPDGHRRLVLFDEGPRPPALGSMTWHRFRMEIDREASGGNTNIIMSVDGVEVWRQMVELHSPANRAYLVHAYGGTDPKEGPSGPTETRYRNIRLSDLP